MQEIWKDIPNYEGLYQVSNLGRVKSVKRQLILKPMLTKNAAQSMKIPASSVCECCKGTRNQTHNYIWRYNKEVVLCQNILNHNIN